MPLQVFCKTEIAIVLVGVADEKGFLRFPSSAPETPGIMLNVRPRTSINELILAKIGDFLGSQFSAQGIDIDQEYHDSVFLSDGREATLYLAHINQHPELVSNDWSTLPELLRGMPQNRNRLPYLRAWQVLSGARDSKTYAIEAADALKYLSQMKE